MKIENPIDSLESTIEFHVGLPEGILLGCSSCFDSSPFQAPFGVLSQAAASPNPSGCAL